MQSSSTLKASPQSIIKPTPVRKHSFTLQGETEIGKKVCVESRDKIKEGSLGHTTEYQNIPSRLTNLDLLVLCSMELEKEKLLSQQLYEILLSQSISQRNNYNHKIQQIDYN